MISFYPALFVLFVDQVSKFYIQTGYVEGISEPILSHFLRVTYIKNPGLAFGVSVGSFAWLLFLITVIITLYIIYYLVSTNNLHYYERMAMSFILGGALGNLIDRGFTLFNLFSYQGVIDFIDIGLFEYSLRYPYIFNVADLSVTVGIVIYLISSLINKNEEEIKENLVGEESNEIA